MIYKFNNNRLYLDYFKTVNNYYIAHKIKYIANVLTDSYIIKIYPFYSNYI